MVGSDGASVARGKTGDEALAGGAISDGSGVVGDCGGKGELSNV